MHFDLLTFAAGLASGAPFLAIVLILIYYQLSRSVWCWRKRRGKGNPGFYPSSIALGAVLQFLAVFYRPQEAVAIEARQEADVEEDEQGETETLRKQLHRQLRRIRRGERVGDLVLRM